MDNLTAGKETCAGKRSDPGYQYRRVYRGETVFEVLQRVCEYAGIQLEYSWTPMYDSYYIQESTTCMNLTVEHSPDGCIK